MLDLTVVGMNRKVGRFEVSREIFADLRRDFGYACGNGVLFSTRKRLRNEPHEFIERASVGILLSDCMRHRTVRMNFVPPPHLIEWKIFGFLGKTPNRVDLGYGYLVGWRFPNRIKLSSFFTRIIVIACFEGKLPSNPVRDHQPVVIRASGELLP